MKMKLQMLGLLAVAATATAFAVVDGLSVARKPKEGEEIRYRMTADVDFGGLPIKAKFLVIDKTVKVESDGTFKIETSQLDGKLEMNGQEQDLPSGGATTTTFSKEGEVKEIAGEQTGPDVYRMANLGLVRDAGKTLNVGDAWTHEFKGDKKTGAVAAKAEYKLLAEEKVGDWDALKISVKYKETEGTDPAGSDGTTWVSKADGSIIKFEQKWSNAPLPGAPAPINGTIKMDREAAK
ncbi:MAG: hypothetical protein ACO1SV_24920 [Fimbriimonas sp.]